MLDYKRKAFTMIELVFVIVVLGILAAVAIPKFAATRDDAQIAKGRSDVAAIRAAIVSERQGRLLQGQSSYINKLHGTDVNKLFENNGTVANGLLQYGIVAQADTNGHWQPATSTSSLTYVYRVMNADNTFTYTPADGKFMCTSGTYCPDLTN